MSLVERMQSQPWPSPEIRAVLRVGKNSSLAAQEILTMATRVVNHSNLAHPKDPRVKSQLHALNTAMTACLEGVMELRKASLRGQEQAAAIDILQLCAATLRHGARIAELLGKIEDPPATPAAPGLPANLLAPRTSQGR